MTSSTLRVEHLRIPDILDDVSLHINAGERVGLIGESGSGKTMTALSILRLVDSSGEIRLHEQDLRALSERGMCEVRGKKIAMVFQEPMSALDPLMRVERQIVKVLTVHGVPRNAAKARVPEMLEQVGLTPAHARRFPHELSGGQRQRVLIAMALAHEPDLLICDEPTTALDVTSQRAIVELILAQVKTRGTALLFITHDLGLVAHTCQRIVVLQEGRVVESGDTTSILAAPAHPYTQRLLEASELPRARPHTPSPEVLVEVDAVSKVYPHRFRAPTRAVDSLSLKVTRGERLGIVGGSGSGKTTLLKMIAGLETPTSGRVSVAATTRMVFQDPRGSLDPRMNVRSILQEGAGPKAGQLSDARLAQALHEVGLAEEMLERFPHEFSGGQRQRISIARALLGNPDVLLADEPVSALDVSVRKKVLSLMDKLVAEHGLTMIFVSHDLHVVRSVCSTVAVMHQGQIVEYGPCEEIFTNPQSPYTRSLLEAVPRIPEVRR
ncbi:ATP-binding cassette domain-containing protein [Corynebacterium kozikiae]|uniref:ATP-binding cassette domain-containing protein n=1 Tax=Corynebacterium kozikiae TaxID=2968469 RepID=UPI00211C3DA3|nr:ABC transporter ATP-binding protein [Corynebacterium sp. 76QC2CO]MCQ9343194.1 ABC transporter ATP-binding protein [Corynebacterium sp. 76QC2CO]